MASKALTIASSFRGERFSWCRIAAEGRVIGRSTGGAELVLGAAPNRVTGSLIADVPMNVRLAAQSTT